MSNKPTCQHALHHLVTKIHGKIIKYEIVLGTFLDINEAFDDTFRSMVANAQKHEIEYTNY